MDYYYHELEKLEKELHDVLHEYPLFKEMLDEIFDKDLKEIDELLEKNDEFYLKKAISKLRDLIQYIKRTSESIDDEYQKFDRLARIWEKENVLNVPKERLDQINDKIAHCNRLIGSHDLNDLKEANKLMEEVLKEIK